MEAAIYIIVQNLFPKNPREGFGRCLAKGDLERRDLYHTRNSHDNW